MFVYAVRTTGVFVRPSCSSRRPLRVNTAFFSPIPPRRAPRVSRPCKRCQPEGQPRELEIAERACAVLDAHPHERVTLAQLSDAVHVSAFHLQRVFKRVVGVSPRQYQAALRGAALRKALEEGAEVTRAAADAGYGSSSRLYASTSRELGMSPSAFRNKGAGLRICYSTATTSLGLVLVAATRKGVCRIAFGDTRAALIDELKVSFANAELVEATERVRPLVEQIEAYLKHGARQCVDLPLDIGASAFQLRVWDALLRIPYGETRSYTQIANELGLPRARCGRSQRVRGESRGAGHSVPPGGPAGRRARRLSLGRDAQGRAARHRGAACGRRRAGCAARAARGRRGVSSAQASALRTDLTLELPFRAPYDWARLLRFLAGRAIPGVEVVEDGAYRRMIDYRGESGLLTVRRHPRRACLLAQLEGRYARVADAALAARLGVMFDVDADPAAIGAHLSRDAWLAPLVAAAPGLRMPRGRVWGSNWWCARSSASR